MKKILSLFFISYTVLASSQNLASGLQACYPMDNNAQNYASTGSPLDGSLINVAPTTGHTALSNTAFSLNGTVGSYIELPDNPGLKSDSVFFSGWFRIDSLPNIQYLVYTTNGCIFNFEAYSLITCYDFSAGHNVFRVSKCGSDCGTKPEINSLVAPVVGNWYHICFYVTNSILKLYVNGVFQSSINHNVQFGYQSGYNVYLGVTNQSNFNLPFKGAIDNVRFYNRELTQQEITQLYTQDPVCAESPVSVIEINNPISKVTIYPNPTTDRVYVESLGENTLVVCDLLGKPVECTKNKVTENMCEVNLLDVIPGIYFVNIANPQGNYLRSIKLIVIK